MSSEPKPEDFTSLTTDKLRYSDTDRQGHINNAVYSTFLETGRVDFLYQAGLPLTDPGTMFALARITIDYRAEVTWPGSVTIGTRLVHVGNSSLRVEQAVFKDGACVATGESVVVQMSATTRRSQPFSPEVAERFRSLLVSAQRSGGGGKSSTAPV